MDYIRGIKNAVYQQGLNIYSKFTKPPEKSEFLAKGILIPSEFVEAGDQLTNICPTWQWKPAAKESLRNTYLPPEKQFLTTRVPCFTRLAETGQVVEEIVDQKSGDQWICLDNKALSKEGKKEEAIEEFHEEEEMKKEDKKPEEKKAAAEDEDIECFDDEDDKPKKTTAPKTTNGKEEQQTAPAGGLISIKTDYFNQAGKGDGKKPADGDKEPGFISVQQGDEKKGEETMRYYDISLVYDMAFFTPRVFLMGYDADMNPLKPEDIFADIADEYARKTVTIENHPALDLQQATVHPCRHADVMKHLIDTIVENGGKIAPHQSLILFLKIFSSIMPNIKYDSTLDYDLE